MQAVPKPEIFENGIATDETPKLLSASDLADRLSVDLKKIYRMIDSKEIPALKVGKEWRFIWEDVLSSLKQRSCYGNKGS